jgi:hypothetical protein
MFLDKYNNSLIHNKNTIQRQSLTVGWVGELMERA